ncbi:MAG: hypothetical protein ACFFAN_06595 [Promethearchaeota archaeon]
MKSIQIIPEYSMEVRFDGNTIELYDQIHDEIIATTKTELDIVRIEKVSFNTFRFWDTVNQHSKLYVDLIHNYSRVKTNAVYILNIHFIDPSHGYYFGTYELGEFVLLGEGDLKIKRRYPIKYCLRGVVAPSGILYFGLRETVNDIHSYFLTKLDWKFGKDPIVWKKSIPASILSINLYENLLFLGLKDGSIQIWDLEREELSKKIDIFENPVSLIEICRDKIIFTSWKGDITALSKEGKIIWKCKPSIKKISGVFENDDGINIVDEGGKFILLNSISGEIIKELQWKFGAYKYGSIASNLVIFRNWIIGAGGYGIWAHWSENHDVQFHVYDEDILMRKLVEHPVGFYSGDDAGYIRFWKAGGLRIQPL